MHAGQEINLQSVVDGSVPSGVAHGQLLNDFTEAVLGDDDERLARVRGALAGTLGAEALVDAAGAVASFNAVVKVADGSGVVVDDFRKDLANGIRDELGLHFGAGQ